MGIYSQWRKYQGRPLQIRIAAGYIDGILIGLQTLAPGQVVASGVELPWEVKTREGIVHVDPDNPAVIISSGGEPLYERIASGRPRKWHRQRRHKALA